jgi:hypothetical protein
MALTRGSTGADLQSSSAEAISASSPDAFDATAPCAFVQKTHWLRRDVNAANNSRSQTAQSDRPRMTLWVHSLMGRPKNSGRYMTVRMMSTARRRVNTRIIPNCSF